MWLSAKLLVVQSDVLAFADAAQESVADIPLPGEVTQTASETPLLGRLRTLIEGERLHLDPELTLAMFVQRMQAPERDVRRLINQELGFDHFRSFLNHHRLVEARRRLADPRRAGDKLVAVALDSGFASIASFNRVFRSAEACTPSQYREAARTGLVPRPRPGDHEAEVAKP